VSFSKSASGSVDDVLSQADGWLGEVIAADEGWNAPEETKDGHGRQIIAGVAALREFTTALPEGRELSVSVAGHANNDGTGNVIVRIDEKLAPAAEADLDSSAEGATEGAASGG